MGGKGPLQGELGMRGRQAPRRWLHWGALLLAAGLMLAGADCSSGKVQAQKQAEAQKQAQAQEQARQEEARRQEEQAREQEQAARKAKEEEVQRTLLPADFGKPLPPPTPPPAQVTQEVPYDQAFPPLPDPIVRVAVISGASQALQGQQIGLMISDLHRQRLEQALGKGIQLAYVSQTDRPQTQQTRVRYRKPFFRAAVQIALLLPEPQDVEPMSKEEADQAGVDVLVQVGTDIRE